MNNFEKIYIDGVPTEKEIKIENYPFDAGLIHRKISANHNVLNKSAEKEPIEPEKPIADRKNDGGRTFKKGSMRSNKV